MKRALRTPAASSRSSISMALGRVAISSVFAFIAVGLLSAVAQASTPEDRVPRTNEGLRATQIAAGGQHTCGLTPAGSATCWGDNGYGQAPPAGVDGPFTQLTAGWYHTCALTPAGDATCWGQDFSGQAPASRTGPFTQITAGDSYTCALGPEGDATCWGYNGYGQAPPAGVTGPFTQITAGANHTCALTPTGNATCWGDDSYGEAPPAGVAGPFTQITGGGYHTCAMAPTGNATCWGYNPFGQAPPAGLTGPFTQVTAGGYHTCALTPAGNATCSGYNGYGQAPPAGVTGPFGAKAISAGGYHTCGITPVGDAVCWGSNREDQAPPAGVTGPFTQVASGMYHTCAVTPAGNATCWGDNPFGQAPPAGVTGSFTQVTAGSDHTCALTPAGNATCWGDNGDGQAPPTGVTGPFTQITAGDRHTCALSPAGNATCWGYNAFGQAPPDGVTGPFTQITAGFSHTCALSPAGNASCWGYNGFGQAPPDGVTGPFTQISAGDYHTCALTPAGNATCWGYDHMGQAPPDGVTGPFTQISAGGYHTCANTLAGNATCWGYDAVGATTGHHAAITSANHSTFTVGASGAFTVTTRGIPMPAITESGELPSGVSLIDNGDGTATLAGTPGPGTAGSYPIAITAANGWGPDATQSFTLTVDPEVPDTTIGSGPSGTTNAASANFTFSSTVDSSTFECQLDADPYQSCASPHDLTGLIDGSHTFSVRATNEGGTDQTPAIRIWTIDTAAPDTTIDTGPSGTVGSTGPTFTFSSEPGATFECRLDAGSFSSCTSPRNYTGLADGSHTFSVRATDAAGNTDPGPATRTWTIDTAQTLAISKDGTGSGTVTSSPAGIDCGQTCETDFGNGVQVTLTAAPDASSTFTGWSGAGCAGSGTCTVTMDQARVVTASFTRITYTLSVTKDGTGSGTVTSTPDGIACGQTCEASFGSGVQVTLIASSTAGSSFSGWGGACSGTGSCVMAMSSAKSVSATFVTTNSCATTVTVANGSFTPKTPIVAQGGCVTWSFTQGAHSAADTRRLGASSSPLFDSGLRSSGIYSYTFTAAGSYSYRSKAAGDPSTMTGAIKVPLKTSATTGIPSTGITVTWSPAQLPGYRYDVQYRYQPPGGSYGSWTNWRMNQTATSGTFRASTLNGRGTYQLRGRLENATTLRTSLWSPTKTITIS